MHSPRLPCPARGQRLSLVNRTHHERRELAALILNFLTSCLERSGKVGLGELPFGGGAARDELDIGLGFPGQATVPCEPAPHPLLAGVIGCGGEAEIAELAE